jgi:hypothetical protein
VLLKNHGVFTTGREAARGREGGGPVRGRATSVRLCPQLGNPVPLARRASIR